MPTDQARHWILTIKHSDWQLPEELERDLVYCKGQVEQGEGGYVHWQLIASFKRKVTRRICKSYFCESAHLEPTRSEAADDYVWKEETAVAGTRFEIGTKPHKRNNKLDWERIWNDAISGDLLAIDPSIRIQHYRTLRTIRADYAAPIAIERKVVVYYGPTGTGKSRRAWAEAGWEAYPKDPRSKFWDGYRDQKNVVFDEFRGGIDIAHVLRWFDRYPVLVEIKGASTSLVADKIWITSNIHPNAWYPDLDPETYRALERRLEIIYID